MKFYNDETIIENPDYPVFYGYKYLFEFKDGTSEIVISPFLKDGCTKHGFHDNRDEDVLHHNQAIFCHLNCL